MTREKMIWFGLGMLAMFVISHVIAAWMIWLVMLTGVALVVWLMFFRRHERV